MSIIHEALKKVQQHREQENGTKVPETTHSIVGQALPGHLNRLVKPKSSEPDVPTTGQPSRCLRIPFRPPMAIAFLTVFLLALFSIEMYFRKNPVVPPITPTKSASQDLTGSLNLNGVLSMENKKVALINNEIYEVGDLLEGMTIVDISVNSVQLTKDGQAITIHTKK